MPKMESDMPSDSKTSLRAMNLNQLKEFEKCLEVVFNAFFYFYSVIKHLRRNSLIGDGVYTLTSRTSFM